MNAKILVFCICVEAIFYLVLYNFHDCTFKMLGNMCVATIYFPGCDVINFEINLISLIKQFFYMTKKSRQKFKYLKYLENKKDF